MKEPEVGRPVRRSRFEVEIVYYGGDGRDGDWASVLCDAVNDAEPNAMYSIDEVSDEEIASDSR